MAGKTPADFWNYRLAEVNKQQDAKAAARNKLATPTVEQFWSAAYNYNTLGPRDDFSTILDNNLVDTVPIGKLYGKTTLLLKPSFGALPATEIPEERPWILKYATTDPVAVSYEDGHPSQEIFEFDVWEDDRLRRCCPLVFVLSKQGTAWR